MFAIQDEIAASIAERLKVTLAGRGEAIVRPPTDNLEAYQLYLKGRALLYQRGLGIPRGLRCFEQAVGLAERYALAWSGLADAHTTRGYYGFAAPDQTMPHAKDAAVRAVALDQSLAEAHNAFAVATLLHDRDWAAADRGFRRALESNPRYVQARCWYAFFYLQLTAGKLEEGAAEAERAVQTDPLSGYTLALWALTLGIAGRTTEAIEQSLKAVDRDPDSFLACWVLQSNYHWGSYFAESVAASEAALTVSGRHPWSLAGLATTYADWGKHAEAQAVHDELTARTRREYVAPAVLAWSASVVDKSDEALALARREYEDRDPFLPFATCLPDLERLRRDSRFRSIRRDLMLPHGG